jgi:uncharacterized protein YqfA (UPF0365 family)
MDNEFWTGFAAGAATAVAMLVVIGIGFLIVRPWIRMKLSGGRGSLFQILCMQLRGNSPMLIVEAYTSLLHSGDEVRLMEVESQYVANRAKITTSGDLMEFVREHKRRESVNKDRRKK